MIHPSTAPASATRRFPWLRLLAGALLAGFLLFLLGREIAWADVLRFLGQAQVGWLLLGVAAIFINSLARAQRWRLLFPREQAPPSLPQALGILLAGQLINNLLPLRGGDISRALLAGRRRGASTITAAATIGAEKLIDVSAAALLVAIVVPYFVLPAWLETNLAGVYTTIALAVLIWAALIFALPAAERYLAARTTPGRPLAALAARVHNLLRGLRALRQRRRLPQLLFWSLGVWGFSIAATWCVLAAFDLTASALAAALVVIIIQGGISVPVAPGHIGVFEWLAVLALRTLGFGDDVALAFALVLHAIVLLPPVLVGLPWLWRATR